MKRIYFALIAAIFVLASCEEWDQVFTTDYGKADVYEPVTMTPNTTIAQLKALYKSGPVKIEKDIVIGGQVVSEDRSGNVYKSIYIQDATGGIELKIGKNALYNDYKLGQWVYVKCGGLTLGAYNGMIQLGYADPTGEYETSYIEVQYIIDTHIFRGKIDTPLQPKKVSAADLLKEENIGCYVELDGLTYAHEIFCLIYIDSYKDKKLYAKGKIVQVIEGDSETDLRVATATNGYDDIVFVAYDPDILDGAHLTEGQYIGVYGRCKGQVSYTSALGAKISIPGLDADSIDQTVKSPQEVQIEAMQAMLDGADFEKVDTSGYGTWKYVAKIQNTTENDYSNVSLVLGIYDASGMRIGETYANATSWAPGETVQFEGYLDSTKADAAVSVKPEIQSFSIGSDYYSPSQLS